MLKSHSAPLYAVPEPVGKSRRSQLGAFGVVGILNTLIDFAIFNAALFLLHYPLLVANLLATALALSFSYFVNKGWVFSRSTAPTRRSMLLFIIITLVGLYGIQSLVIFTFTHWLLFPAEVAGRIAGALHITNLSDEFVVANTAKFIATVTSAIWNFTLYKKFVFKT